MTDPPPAVLAAVIACTDRAIPTPRQAQGGEVSENKDLRERLARELWWSIHKGHPFGIHAWDLMAEGDRAEYRTMAAAAVEVLRGEGR